MTSIFKLAVAGVLSLTMAASFAAPASGCLFYKEGFSCHPLGEQIKARMMGNSYRENDHIGFGELRYVRIKYYDFDGNVKDGELVVNEKIAQDTVEIFYDLYQHKYPLQEVSLIDKYGGDDDKSMRANNTSAFNYRVIAGSENLSRHAYGMAIDINPRINPCVKGGAAQPANGSLYAERDPEKCRGKYRDFMIQKGDYIYQLFRAHGFTWGGDWNSLKDYQHFEKSM